ncbi:uncharacterized protein LOC129591557 [Paramacrobiotus metropolitanus]|uniref:uncharacterized protein LOC129591557 n=1 Tax=Paramacrobiotus metropolitanus TaxID=2943436 RepID=UPI0024462DF1|nr:uncharacterized protein LOC129591557 [Paramacrobiotus metropolitanus]
MNGSQNHISLVVYLDATSVKSHGQEDDLQYGHAVSSKMGPICQYMWANFLLSALRVFLECGPFGWVAYSLVVCRSMASDSAVQTAVAWFFFGMVGFFLVTEAFMSLMSLRILRSVQQWRPGTKSEPVSEVVACLDMAYVPLVSTMVLNCLMLVFYLMLECNGSGWKDLSEYVVFSGNTTIQTTLKHLVPHKHKRTNQNNQQMFNKTKTLSNLQILNEIYTAFIQR